jgi:uncharacterized protein YndB with AHSA1/START domain
MRELKYELYLAAPPHRVWEAIVEPEETKKWVYGAEIQSSFAVGSEVKWVGKGKDGKEMVHVQGKILELKPTEIFSYELPTGEFKSRVTYRLEPAGADTHLTLTHDQIEDGDECYDSSSKGWPIMLSSLKTLVETGKPLELTLAPV